MGYCKLKYIMKVTHKYLEIYKFLEKRDGSKQEYLFQ